MYHSRHSAFNSIEEIPDIRSLSSLEELDLCTACLLSGQPAPEDEARLQLRQPQEALPQYPSAHADNNAIRAMSRELVKFAQLAHLNLSANKIKRIQHLNTGNFAKSLRVLNLADNAIQKMEGLDTLESLEQLNLSKAVVMQATTRYPPSTTTWTWST